MKRFFAYIKILRPTNFLITFFSIYFAIIIADKSLLMTLKAFFGSLAGSLIAGAGMVINDYFDFEIDKINRPERPIPSGKISPQSALIYYSVINLIALILLINTNQLALIIALFSIVTIFLYSYKLKSKGLVGNITVGFMTALAFIFGGVIGGNVLPLLFPSLFAFLINIAREILKDIEDIEGDKTKDQKTFPIVYGESRAIRISVFLIILTIIATIIPYFIGIYNLYYLLIILFAVDLGLVFVIKKILSFKSKEELRSISDLIKYEMIVGLIAIYIGVN